jgi:alpha-glucosidase
MSTPSDSNSDGETLGSGIRGLIWLVIAILAWPLFGAEPPAPASQVGSIPPALQERLRLDAFYKKHVDALGFPIFSSDKVSDEALLEAAYLINQMLADRDDVREALIKGKVRCAVMAPTEMTTDIPEHADLRPKEYWDRRARGLGATRWRPAVSCGEENLLNLKGDRYPRENILIHEFAHVIHEMGLMAIDNEFDGRLLKTYQQAMDQGRWKETYAATNHKEYWAEGVQSYFDTNAPPGGVHNDVNTREKLERYDPDLFQLIDETFRKPAWRYVRYDERGRTQGSPEPSETNEPARP